MLDTNVIFQATVMGKNGINAKLIPKSFTVFSIVKDFNPNGFLISNGFRYGLNNIWICLWTLHEIAAKPQYFLHRAAGKFDERLIAKNERVMSLPPITDCHAQINFFNGSCHQYILFREFQYFFFLPLAIHNICRRNNKASNLALFIF